jgi:hypothetical protein
MAKIVIPRFEIPHSHNETRLLRGDTLQYDVENHEFFVERSGLGGQKLKCVLPLGGGLNRTESWNADESRLHQPEEIAEFIARRFGLVLTKTPRNEKAVRWILADPPPKGMFKFIKHKREP